MNATIDQLERRLRQGEAIIEAESDPNERHRLETHWLDLLHQYERAVDRERQQERKAA